MQCSPTLDGCRILALAVPRRPPYFCVVPLIESYEPSRPDKSTLAIRPKGAPSSLILYWIISAIAFTPSAIDSLILDGSLPPACATAGLPPPPPQQILAALEMTLPI